MKTVYLSLSPRVSPIMLEMDTVKPLHATEMKLAECRGRGSSLQELYGYDN
jgi:hypothetical protein